jgi:methionine-rich copper-binding protein CopC
MQSIEKPANTIPGTVIRTKVMGLSNAMRSGLLGLLFVLALGALHAFAHSQKESTTPTDGATVSGSPPAIGMDFNAPMRITHVELTNAEGDTFELARDKSLAARKVFSAKPADLPPGRYRVEWRGLAEDGHAMQGTFSFIVE